MSIKKSVILGIDLGGTNIKVGLVHRSGRLLAFCQEPSEPERGIERLLEKTAALVFALLERKCLMPMDVMGCGIGVPGPMDSARTKVYRAVNIPGLERVPLKHWFERRLRSRVVLENDANVAAVGEHWKGAGKKVRSMVLYTLGTGIGGGIILDGKLWHGASGNAAELGHMQVVPNGALCGCGARGCLEAYAAAPALLRRFCQLQQLCVKEKPSLSITPQAIFDAARKGDPLARKVVEETAEYIGVAIANVAHTLDPELFVLSGGLAQAGTFFIAKIRGKAKMCILRLAPARKGICLVQGKLGIYAGVIGAAGWAIEQLEHKPYFENWLGS